jgi:D-hexose-6-phosphate mutarotase
MKSPIKFEDDKEFEGPDKYLNSEHYNNVVTIRSLFELTSRIDERVKAINENNLKIEKRFETYLEVHNQLLQRITALESKNGTEIKKNVEDLSNRLRDIEQKFISIDIITKSHQTRWEKIFEQGTKLTMAIAAAFIIWKAGWASSHILAPNLNIIPAPITATP